MPLFSGEPLPVAPRVSNPELEAFHRKLLDYLRRLGGKIDAFVSNPPEPPPPEPAATNIETFAAFIDANPLVDTSYASINFNQVLWRDSVYEPIGAAVKVLEPGLYLVMVDLLPVGVGFLEAQLLFSGAGVEWTLVYGYSTINGDETLSICVPVPLVAHFQIAVQVRADTTAVLNKDGCRLTILRIRDETDGGTSGGGIGWHDDDADGAPDEIAVREL